ncbi:MAG: prepilin-type N-terminal cleavage/methylation domain-containing protein, partial [Candidatus Eisenbacteria bacterium]|nr:prepilin-type N-terminal cleavage/methylation domain-containing protein [Candidatus Latescibacterota bacterium]MBD3302652.1 prepilin-type N-terminal cleavage/methylation domain-containing protein [Candidatus Eisenbacteria bacterium]
MHRSTRSRSGGFTLVELMVVVVVTAVVAVGLYQVLFAGRRSHDVNKNAVEMQQNARIAISSLADDFRHVSYGKDPTQPSIRYAGPDSIVFIADIVSDTDGAEVISYHLHPDGDPDTPNPNDTILMKSVADSGGTLLYATPQSYGIAQNGLSLSYFNGGGVALPNPVPQPEQIGEMAVEVTATEARRWKQQPYETMALSATIYPRNLPLSPARSRPSTPACDDPVFPNCNSATLGWETPTTNTDGT